MDFLRNSHNLRLSNWGPYTKKYIGISHISDEEQGLRFDLSVFPAYYRRRADVPNVRWESGYHPWEAASDLSYFCHRHELEWKDRVYCDVSFSEIDDNARLIRCECVNATDKPQNIVMHYMASMNFPTHGSQPVLRSIVTLPEGAVWVDGLDYEELEFAVPRPQDNLVWDGLFRGEVRSKGDHAFVGGSALGAGFGKDNGDCVSYRINLKRAMPDAVLTVRYHTEGESTSEFKADGLVNADISFAATDSLQLLYVQVSDLKSGEHVLRLTSLGTGAIEIDGFVLAPAAAADQIRFDRVDYNYQPEILAGPTEKSLILKYENTDMHYGVAWGHDLFEVREFLCADLDIILRDQAHNHVSKVLRGQGEGHYTNVFLRPVTIAPDSTEVIYGLVCSGSRENVERMLAEFDSESPGCADTFQSARSRAIDLPADSDGYKFSQQMMAANTLTGIVYPIYTQGQYIKHYPPGRWWDSLYTWDSGFIGLGLAELDIDRAIDCLNAYMTEPGNSHAAFIHHGSPVPVQHYLFLELWNRTQSRELLEYFYPRLRQYHQFMVGNLGSSTTRTLKSNLLKTWDYFYNSGGWDDYPPQVYVHANKLEPSVAPAVNTSHAVRTAKILRMAAAALGLGDDIREYEDHAAVFSNALQQHSWDEEARYFSYVRHDEDGRPVGILRHESGANFDMGLDGTSPLIAGVCTGAQEEILLGRLMDEKRLWTKIGLSTVDQSAPYYRPDGYWNGAVWFPHQWFIWKTLLDLGKPDEAYRVARTALDLWKSEVEESYNCFEHFIVASGRGAGWHHFSGLSSPILSWFAAYHRSGRLTCGLDTWVIDKQFSSDNTSFAANLRVFRRSERPTCVVVTMNSDHRYQATWNGSPAELKEQTPGVLNVMLPCEAGEGKLQVVRSYSNMSRVYTT